MCVAGGCNVMLTESFNSSHSQRAWPDLPGVLLRVVAVQAVSRGATLTAVATGAAVAVG